MALYQKSYVITNANSQLGMEVAKDLLQQNAVIILAGGDYGALQQMQKELEVSHPDRCKISLLEPSKEIDWKDLMQKLDENEYTLNGIINIHEIESEFQSINQMDYTTLIDNIDNHVWGTILGMRVLRPLFESNSSIVIMNILKAANEDIQKTDLYCMIEGALSALCQSIKNDMNNKDINMYFHHDVNHSSISYIQDILYE